MHPIAGQPENAFYIPISDPFKVPFLRRRLNQGYRLRKQKKDVSSKSGITIYSYGFHYLHKYCFTSKKKSSFNFSYYSTLVLSDFQDLIEENFST